MLNGQGKCDGSEETKQRFRSAIARFDEENARDPNVEVEHGSDVPRELLYARRLSHWVQKLCPDASEELRLAARCQHICRWMIPRDSYEMTRTGYLRWRTDLKGFHARKSEEILRALGFDEGTVSRVRDLNMKKGFPKDPEGQVLEDALCLVFLQFQFADLASKTEEGKMIGVLRKTWKKMSDTGRQEALKLAFGEREQGLLKRALGE